MTHVTIAHIGQVILKGNNMNRFIINYSPDLIARDLCDKHVVKMPLEEAQMLCTTLRLHAPEYAKHTGLYRAVHQKHPCTIWAGLSRANFEFSLEMFRWMCKEYTHRYGKTHAVSGDCGMHL